jgi:copper chaperone CopZ
MRMLIVAGAIGGLAILAYASPADAQLVRVTETIHGMDCAPCAYGVERRLQRMDGVSGVTLSLNEGYADILFGERNAVTLESIRKAIRQSGFSGEGGDVVVRGTVDHANGQAVLTTPAGEVFVLAVGPGRAAGAAAPPPAAVVEAGGRVDKSADARGQWVLRVERLEEAPPSEG